MLKIGLRMLLPGTLAVGFIYLYFVYTDISLPDRQAIVRFLWFYLFSFINIWLAIILKWGKTL